MPGRSALAALRYVLCHMVSIGQQLQPAQVSVGVSSQLLFGA